MNTLLTVVVAGLLVLADARSQFRRTYDANKDETKYEDCSELKSRVKESCWQSTTGDMDKLFYEFCYGFRMEMHKETGCVGLKTYVGDFCMRAKDGTPLHKFCNSGTERTADQPQRRGDSATLLATSDGTRLTYDDKVQTYDTNAGTVDSTSDGTRITSDNGVQTDDTNAGTADSTVNNVQTETKYDLSEDVKNMCLKFRTVLEEQQKQYRRVLSGGSDVASWLLGDFCKRLHERMVQHAGTTMKRRNGRPLFN